MAGIDSLKDSLQALADGYNIRYSKKASAEDLITYAEYLQNNGTNIFENIDAVYDGDKTSSNSISSQTFLC